MEPYSDNVAEKMWALLVNRTDTYAIQNSDGSYTRIAKPLSIQILKRHLSGEITVGAYQINQWGQVKELVFDVDEDHVEDPYETARSLLSECVAKPSKKAPKFWPESVLLEASRWPDPSFHIRVLFDPPIRADFARWLGLKILGHAGLTTADVEIFPKQTRVTKTTPFGNFVRLPLGIHRKYGKRSCLLDHSNFKPIPDTAILEAYGASFSESDLKELAKALVSRPQIQISPSVKAPWAETLEPSANEEAEIVRLLAKYWRKGFRNKLEMAFLGFCIKKGISHHSAKRIIERVCDLTGDEEKPARLRLVDYHYTSRRGLGCRLLGASGLREVFRELSLKWV